MHDEESETKTRPGRNLNDFNHDLRFNSVWRGLSNSHVGQQHELESMLAAHFAGEPGLRYLNLGNCVDLQDPSLCWDGMHLTEEGNRRIAAAFTRPTLEMLRQ